MKGKTLLPALLVVIHLSACSVLASERIEAETSPKSPWGQFEVVEEPASQSSQRPWWKHVLLWVPNRALDFIDIFRVDVGLGPAYGGVVRITDQGQAGYRQMNPGSFRIGAFGRSVPVMIETSNEIGIGPGFKGSDQREVCRGEIGLGLDIVAVGAYAGICMEELVDFVAGIFFIDLMDDDL